MLQEPVLLSATIAENIAYGRPDEGLGQIMEAARATHAHSFITALPQGYQTLVGEWGYASPEARGSVCHSPAPS